MKTMILGISMFMTGAIGFAILCASAITTTYNNGSLYYGDIWRMFGITPVAVIFLALGIVGMIVSIMGLFIKK